VEMDMVAPAAVPATVMVSLDMVAALATVVMSAMVVVFATMVVSLATVVLLATVALLAIVAPSLATVALLATVVESLATVVVSLAMVVVLSTEGVVFGPTVMRGAGRLSALSSPLLSTLMASRLLLSLALLPSLILLLLLSLSVLVLAVPVLPSWLSLRLFLPLLVLLCSSSPLVLSFSSLSRFGHRWRRLWTEVVAGLEEVAERERAGGATSCPLHVSTCSVFLCDRLGGCQANGLWTHLCALAAAFMAASSRALSVLVFL